MGNQAPCCTNDAVVDSRPHAEIDELRKQVDMLSKEIVELRDSKGLSPGQHPYHVVESDSDAELEDKHKLETQASEIAATFELESTSKRTRQAERAIRHQASLRRSIPSDQPVYVGKAAHLKHAMLHGVLYFDAGSTGTRPQIFVYAPGQPSLNEFWMLSRSKEIQSIRLHEHLENEYANDELLKRLQNGTDAERLQLTKDVRLGDEFISYIQNTIHQTSKIVNRWMEKEKKENGVLFWPDGQAILFTNILIAVTGGLRSVVGQSPKVVEQVNVRLTSYLADRLDDAHVLNGIHLTVELLTGEHEAMCEASAVSVLSSLDSKSKEPGAVVSMGGATVQISAKEAGTTAFVSVPVARKMAWSAAERQIGGSDPKALSSYETEYKTAALNALSNHPKLLKQPQNWNAVSGLFFVAKDNGFETEVRMPVDDIVSRFRAKLPEKLASGATAKDVGSVVAAMTVISHLKGFVTFQRQWLNRRTNQRLNGNVSTGYVLRRLGFTDDK